MELKNDLSQRLTVEPFQEDPRVKAYLYYCDNVLDGEQKSGVPWAPGVSGGARESSVSPSRTMRESQNDPSQAQGIVR